MTNKKNNNFGFTLIELLVTTSIIIALATIVVGVITTTFRTSAKTSSQEEVRKNGNYAISQITKTIQFADNFEGASEDNYYYDPSCSQIATYNYIQVNSDDIPRTVGCFDQNGNEAPSLDGQSLINLNSVAVAPGTCKLTCSMNESSSPIIGVDFTLTLEDELKSNLPEGNVNIDFSTSIKMRNF